MPSSIRFSWPGGRPIAQLEQHELVRRERDPRDRRAHQLRLTDRAHAVLSNANAAVDELEDEIFAGFGPREHARLIKLLQQAADHAELPDGIHPGLRRRRRANVLATGEWRA